MARYYSEESGWTSGEAAALMAPLLGFQPEELCGYVVVGITHDMQVQASGNGDAETSIMLLREAIARIIASNSRTSASPPEGTDNSADALLRAIFGEATDKVEAYDALADARSHFEALDGWLSAGGFPPEAWNSDPAAVRPYVRAQRPVRTHSSDDMDGLGEFATTTEPVAVVIRPDGSVDAYGLIAVVDQRL